MGELEGSIDGSSLANVFAILEKIANTTKRTEKRNIIAAHVDDKYFREVVVAALDPYKVYKLTSCSPYSQVAGPGKTNSAQFKYNERTVANIFAKLNDLANARGAGLRDKDELSWLAACDKDTVKVVNRILKKDLRCGAGVKTFVEFFPEIPNHSVMLCDHDFERFKHICNLDPTRCLVSPKLDGVRTWAVMGENVQYLSRNGQTYNNFHMFDDILVELKEQFKKALPGTICDDTKVIFDGECIAEDRDFDSFVGNAKKENADTTQFRYNIFDIVIIHNGTVSDINLDTRLYGLQEAYEHITPTTLVQIVKHDVLLDWDTVPRILRDVIDSGEEGLVLKYRYGQYKLSRSKEWCKMKRRDITHDTLDLVVVGVQEGEGAFAELMGALVCDYNGVQVKVGTGFTVEERYEYFKNPPKMIEVDYQEITKDGSLRFPVFVKDRTHDKYIPEDSQED